MLLRLNKGQKQDLVPDTYLPDDILRSMTGP
jgi:hypothetical protein